MAHRLAGDLAVGVVPPNSVSLLVTRPLAIEFTVVFEDWGRVQRLFEIPT